MPYFTLRLLGPYAALTRTRRPTAAMSHIDSSRVSAISNVIPAISTWPKTATVNNICSIVSIYLLLLLKRGAAQHLGCRASPILRATKRVDLPST